MTKVIWTEPAVADLQAIVDYISRDSETFAIAFAQKVLKATDKLQTFPQIDFPRLVDQSLNLTETTSRS